MYLGVKQLTEPGVAEDAQAKTGGTVEYLLTYNTLDLNDFVPPISHLLTSTFFELITEVA